MLNFSSFTMEKLFTDSISRSSIYTRLIYICWHALLNTHEYLIGDNVLKLKISCFVLFNVLQHVHTQLSQKANLIRGKSLPNLPNGTNNRNMERKNCINVLTSFHFSLVAADGGLLMIKSFEF